MLGDPRKPDVEARCGGTVTLSAELGYFLLDVGRDKEESTGGLLCSA